MLRFLRESNTDDVDSYQSRADVCEYLLLRSQVAREGRRADCRARGCHDPRVDGDYWQLAVELPETPDAAARVIRDMYFTIKSVENLGGEIGWVFHPEFHGRGYASEAARAILDIAFSQVGLHRVIADSECARRPGS